jgi:hypothetical protein
MKSTNNQAHESPYYDRETLYREVWEEPMIHVAKRYGVSDVALTKTCKKLRVPKPGLGYWAKKVHGHEVEKPPLPEFSDPPKILRRGAQKPVQPTPERESFEDRLAPEAFKKAFDLVDRENETDMQIEVPDELTIMHPFVQNTDRELRSRLKYRGSRSQYLRVGSSGADTFNVCVSPDNIDRTLRILQALCDAFSIRNIAILTGEETSYSTPAPTLRIIDVDLKFRIFEPAKRTMKPDSTSRSRHREYEYSATGILQFEIEAPSYRKEYRAQWRDTKRRMLEDRLNEVVKGLYKAAAWNCEWKAQAKKYRAERAIEEARRQEEARIARIEAHRVELFERDTVRFFKHLELRRYLDAVRTEALNRADTVDRESEIGKWLDWAEQHVESMNPLNGEFPAFNVEDPGTVFHRPWQPPQ